MTSWLRRGAPAQPEETKEQRIAPSLEGLNAQGVKKASEKHWVADYDFLAHPECVEALCQGGTAFAFVCTIGTSLSPKEIELVNAMINITAFEDEQKQNNVPIIDISDRAQAAKYTVAITKTAYLLPNMTIDQFTPMFLADVDYQRGCQPGGKKIWPKEEGADPLTFRMTKTIISYVWDLTIQFKVSELPQPVLAKLEETVTGVPIHRGLLLERTKRRIEVIDATAKVKSILMYSAVKGGVLVTNLTAVLNTSIPRVAAAIVNNLSSWGAQEAAATASLTRAYLAAKFGWPEDGDAPAEGAEAVDGGDAPVRKGSEPGRKNSSGGRRSLFGRKKSPQ